MTNRDLLIVAGLVGLVFLAGCKGGTTQLQTFLPSNPAPPNPVPTIITISPASTFAGSAAFGLAVTGTNFISSSVVNFGGTAVATNFISATQLTATIPAAAVAAGATATVVVSNPAPGGGTSNAMSFAIGSATNAVPTISSISPSCSPIGGEAFGLTVFGSNFVPGSVVRWNGSDRPTTVNAGTALTLTAQIPASDIAAVGTAAVTVFNPPPGGGVSSAVKFNVGAGGPFPKSIAVDPTGKFAYVANEGCSDFFPGNVSMYTINPSNGLLTSIGSPVNTVDSNADSVAVDPSGRFVYVAYAGTEDTTGGVSSYTINATTGVLMSTGTVNAPCAGPPSPGSCAPVSVAVAPSGKFVYVANEGGLSPTSISMFTIDPTNGTLASLGIIPAGGRTFSVTVHPSGQFAYVTDEISPGNSSEVSMYAINTTTGVLTTIGRVAAGLSAGSIAIHPSGKFAYVTNFNSNDVSMYTIDTTTGILTPLGPIAAGTGPASVATYPTGKFAYVTNFNSNDVSMYAINATTGILTTIGTIAAGSSPISIVIHASGKFAYVTNFNSNNVSMYSIDAASGALTLIGTIGT